MICNITAAWRADEGMIHYRKNEDLFYFLQQLRGQIQ